jgi:hypothetical protein
MTIESQALIVAIVQAVALFVGGFLALWQWRGANKIKRGELIHQILDKIQPDSEVAEMLDVIEYEKPWYDESFHGSGKNEKLINKLFFDLSYVCYLYEVKLINNKEFRIVEYGLMTTCQSKQTQEYLWNLFHYSKIKQVPPPFPYLIEYMRKHIFTKYENTKFDSGDSEISGYENRIGF